MKKNIGIIVQSRLTSKRFPKKVIKKIGKLSITEILFKRLKLSKYANEIIFAIPSTKKNDILYDHLQTMGANIFRGEENNVLKRYFLAAKKFKIDIVTRITGDCPLVDPKIIDKLILLFKKKNLDYLRTSPKTYPDGFDVEIFSFYTLRNLIRKARNKYDLEHVTSFIKKNKKEFKYKEIDYKNKKNYDYNFIKLSLDTKHDFENIRNVLNTFNSKVNFSLDDIFIEKKFSKIFKKDLKNKKNLYIKTKTGQKIWERAKKTIAGGNMILSKNPERFLPGLWPTYYKSAKGCKIEDYDKNLYIDMSLMGIGTNVLGYSNKDVDNAVRKNILKGNMSTLNCKEEVLLAVPGVGLNLVKKLKNNKL